MFEKVLKKFWKKSGKNRARKIANKQWNGQKIAGDGKPAGSMRNGPQSARIESASRPGVGGWGKSGPRKGRE